MWHTSSNRASSQVRKNGVEVSELSEGERSRTGPSALPEVSSRSFATRWRHRRRWNLHSCSSSGQLSFKRPLGDSGQGKSLRRSSAWKEMTAKDLQMVLHGLSHCATGEHPGFPDLASRESLAATVLKAGPFQAAAQLQPTLSLFGRFGWTRIIRCKQRSSWLLS